MSAVKVRFISDVACPFCYIGYKQLLAASSQSKIPVSITYHSYLLNPSLPEEGYPRKAFFKDRFGVELSENNPMQQRLREMGKEVGINFQLLKPDVISNTRPAQALLLKAHQELGQSAHEKLLGLFFRAYFEEGLDIGSESVYTRLAQEAGLTIPSNYLTSEEGQAYIRKVYSQDNEAKSKYNVSGVPNFVFEEKFSVSGAQGASTLSSILQRVQNEK